MALIKCRECGQQVSSRAIKCPHCGAPASGSPAVAMGIVAALLGGLFFAGLLASQADQSFDAPLILPMAVGVAVVVIGCAALVLKLKSGR